MDTSYIEYSDCNSFSPALIRFLKNDPELDPFKSYNAEISGFEKLINAKTVNADRSLLHQVLINQYAEISLDTKAPVAKNINLLKQGATYTVCTGHQLNLFTGPLYFIYKIATTIKLAAELKANFPEKNFVPIYWMATEDHDFDEINHTYSAGKKIQWNQKVSGATGRVKISDIKRVIKSYTNTLGVSENAGYYSELIESAYAEGRTLAQATRVLVHSLFAAHGLLVLDADDPGLKKQFSAIMLEDILREHSYKNITQTNKELKQIGIDAQVQAREINFFYLRKGLRERIVADQDKFSVLNSDISFSAEELRIEMDTYPERFSPNVVMRPLYQELILPNLAYIGGGAEISYWLQLKRNFDFYKVEFPILILRNSAMLTSQNLGSKLKRLNLNYKDIFNDLEVLKKQWVSSHTVHVLNLQDEWQDLSCIFEKIKLRAHKIDPTLEASTEAVKKRLEKALKNLEAKLMKAEKRNYSEALDQISTIKSRLFPKGGLQERSDNFGQYFVQYGQELIDKLITDFQPLKPQFTILENPNR